jgi:ribosomal protein S18 acetylase RimI-like enzyme
VNRERFRPGREGLVRSKGEANREAVTHIWDIGVEPAHQGHGYGGRAIDLVAAEARQGGSASLTLNVFEFNSEAKRLYERKGFVAGPPVDGQIPMARSLA